MDYEMESLIQALVIQINMVWNQFHEIIHELIRYAHALWFTVRNMYVYFGENKNSSNFRNCEGQLLKYFFLDKS